MRYAAAVSPPAVFTVRALRVSVYDSPEANDGTSVEFPAEPALVTPASMLSSYPATVESSTDKNSGDAPTRMFFAFPMFCAIAYFSFIS